MSENTPPIDDDLDPTPPPSEDIAPLEPTEGHPVRYCVYDNTLLRFVSGVVDTLEEAEELALDAPEAHDVEVREV